MASIDFYADSFGVQNLSGSGLGFYGGSFGASVNVGEYQGTTFITNGNGTSQGPQVNNIKFLNSMSGIIGSATSGVLLTQIPNYLATLNIRFTHDTAVQVQNVKLRIYDRSNINNPASGVTTKVAELIHLGETQVNNGSGDTTWHTPNGSSVIVDFAPSPGLSGTLAGNGSNSTASVTRHDWYAAISASPDSVGSKTLYGLYFQLEYL